MGQVLDVLISHLHSFRGLYLVTHSGTRGGRCNHITFVQVHIASLAWAPFNAGRDQPGARPSRVLAHDVDVVQQT
jgi:hypothetical protein